MSTTPRQYRVNSGSVDEIIPARSDRDAIAAVKRRVPGTGRLGGLVGVEEVKGQRTNQEANQ